MPIIELISSKSRNGKRVRKATKSKKPKRSGNPARVMESRIVARARTPAGGFRTTRNSALYPRQYGSSLLNPFIFGGVRLGWGCLTESQLAVLRTSGSFTTNADGSATIIFNNDLSRLLNTSVGMVGVNVAGAGTTPSYTYPAWSGASSISSLADASRIISAGFRILPNIALTSAPGQVAVTDYPSGRTLAALNGTPNNILALSQTKVFDSRNGATWTWRPTDPDDFVFLSAQQATNASTYKGTTGIITLVNLPASSSFYLEGVMHVEYLNGSAQPVDENRRQLPDQTVSSAGITAEQFHAGFKTLPCNCPETPSSNPDDLPNMLSEAWSMTQRGIRAGAKHAIRSVGSAAMNTMMGRLGLHEDM